MLAGILNFTARATYSLLTYFSTPTEIDIHVVALPPIDEEQRQPLTSEQIRAQKKRDKQRLKKERRRLRQQTALETDPFKEEMRLQEHVEHLEEESYVHSGDKEEEPLQLDGLVDKLVELSLKGDKLTPVASDNDDASEEDSNKFKKPISPPLACQVRPFVPSFAPTDSVIPVEPHIQRLLTKLNHQGYWAYMVGGVVRDRLLGIPHHDTDIITNCPKEKLAEVLEIACSANNFRTDLFQIGHDIDVVCSTKTLIDELKKRDLTINALIANANGFVFDPLIVIDDLKAPCLKLLGNIDHYLKDDPSKILRLIRHSNHVKKVIPSDYVKPMQQNAKAIVTLPFGVYLKNIENLFLRGNAFSNLYTIIVFQLSPFLLPAPQLKNLRIDLSRQ